MQTYSVQCRRKSINYGRPPPLSRHKSSISNQCLWLGHGISRWQPWPWQATTNKQHSGRQNKHTHSISDNEKHFIRKHTKPIPRRCLFNTGWQHERVPGLVTRNRIGHVCQSNWYNLVASGLQALSRNPPPPPSPSISWCTQKQKCVYERAHKPTDYVTESRHGTTIIIHFHRILSAFFFTFLSADQASKMWLFR